MIEYRLECGLYRIADMRRIKNRLRSHAGN
jgi:hypothetical protein